MWGDCLACWGGGFFSRVDPADSFRGPESDCYVAQLKNDRD